MKHLHKYHTGDDIGEDFDIEKVKPKNDANPKEVDFLDKAQREIGERIADPPATTIMSTSIATGYQQTVEWRVDVTYLGEPILISPAFVVSMGNGIAALGGAHANSIWEANEGLVTLSRSVAPPTTAAASRRARALKPTKPSATRSTCPRSARLQRSTAARSRAPSPR